MTRRASLLVVALLLCSSLVPAAHALRTAHTAHTASGRPSVDPLLARQLRTSSPTARLLVYVHGKDIGLAREAVRAHGLKMIDAFRKIGVAVALGTPAQIGGLKHDTRAIHLEGDPKIRFFLDTSHIATRSQELYEGFTATATEPQPDICTTERKKVRNPSGHGYHWENVTTCQPQPPTTVEKHVKAAGTGVTVAVIDTGVDGTHPFFQQDGKSKVVRNMKAPCLSNLALCPEDFGLEARPWIDVTSTTNDTDTLALGGHGTHVNGIVGGVLVDGPGHRQLHGAAPGAKLIGLSVAEADPFYGAEAALNWVLENHKAPCGEGVLPAVCPPIKAVNNSYGPAYIDSDLNFDPGSTVAKLQEALVGEGVVVVWAAGNGDAANDGGSGDDNRVNPPSQDPKPGVISVANYDDGNSGARDNAIDPTSSRGKAGHPKTYPDISAPGTNILSSCRPHLPTCALDPDLTHTDYRTLSGTSMASPTVAGIVAQLFQVKPDATPAEIENALVDTAHQFSARAPYEYDTRNKAATTGTSFDKGHGLVDVVAAASKLLAASGPDATALCSDPAGPVAVDPEGDATAVALDLEATGKPSEPSLDITRLDLSWDAPTSTIHFVEHVADIGDTNPPGAPWSTYSIDFAYGGAAPQLVASRNDALGADFTLDGNPVSGEIDTNADTISFSLTPADFANDNLPLLSDGSTLSGFSLITRYDSGVILAPLADQADGRCPYTIGLGAVTPPFVPPTPPPPPPPPPSPPPHDSDGSLSASNPRFTWDGEGGTNQQDVFGCDGVDASGCQSKFLDVTVLSEGGTLDVSITADIAANDYDLYVYDPYGEEVGSSANPGTLDPITRQLGENVSIPITTSGVYEIRVIVYQTAESTYSGVATLS